MEFTNHIGIFENAFDKNFCNDAIDFFNTKVATGVGIPTTRDIRNDISLGCLGFGSFDRGHLRKKLDEVLDVSYKEYRQKYAVQQFNLENGEHIDSGSAIPRSYENVGYKIQKSSQGGGFVGWHYEFDHGSQNHKNRFLVWMIYLNDVERGGKTEFINSLSVKPQRGTLVLWPAYFTHLHRAAPDLQEDKYIMTGWFTYESN